MRKLAWWQHALIAAVVTLLLFALYSHFQRYVPHPEDFSPQVFFVAALMLLAGCVRMGRQPLRWVYWLIFGLCVFVFLDEIAYGVELMGFEPIYIERYNFYIRDVHSSLGFVSGVLEQWLPEAGWNPSLFISLMQILLGLLALAVLLWWLARWGLQAAGEAAWQQRTLRLTLLASLLTSLGVLVYLLLLPSDPKNTLLLGLSPLRLATVLGLLTAGGLAAWLLRQPQRWAGVQARMDAWLQRHALLTSLVLAAGVLVGLYTLLNASFTFLPDALVRLERSLPLALWGMAQAVWLWLGVQLWTGRLRTPMSTMLRDTLQAFRQHPTFVYTAAAIVVILIAQLIDQNYLPLDELVHTPNYHIVYWGVWAEETLEMIGAFLFAMGALVMPPRAAVTPPQSRSQ